MKGQVQQAISHFLFSSSFYFSDKSPFRRQCAFNKWRRPAWSPCIHSHATDRSNFCWIPSSSLAVQRQPSSVIKPTPHHASRNQTRFLSGWTDRSVLSFEVPNGFFLLLPIWLSDSLASWPSAAGSDQTHSAFFFVFHLSVSGPLSPQRDAFIQPWQSMTTTAHLWKSLFKK